MTTAERFNQIYTSFKSMSYEEITASIECLLNPLTIKELKALATQLEIYFAEKTKSKIIACFVRRVKELKASSERCDFRF